MKTLSNIPLLVAFLLVSVFAHASESVECFKLKTYKENSVRLSVDKQFASNAVIMPFSEKTVLSSLAVSGIVEKENDDYFVRVILKDKTGVEYIIFESYDELNDSPSFSFSDYCEETIMLNAVEPDSVKLVCRNARLTLNNVSYTTSNAYPVKGNLTDNAEYTKIRREQQVAKAEKINSYNIAHNKLWRAGVTPLSEKSFEIKKRVMGLTDESNTCGLEYYIGGIFEMGSKQGGNSYDTTRSRTTPISLFVDSFDWRNRHGKNWMTPVKHQGHSGYCASFAIAGSIEAVSNLYYNQLLDINLSEQQLANCSEGNSYSEGSTMPVVLDYAVNNSIYNEASYPFVDSSNQQCLTDIIVPDTIVKISGYSLNKGLYAPIDSVKSAIIHKGPLVADRWNLYSIAGLEGILFTHSHAMSLVGYGTIHEGDTILPHTGNTLNNDSVIIMQGDPRIGETFWIFKDSYGTYTGNNGYHYVLYENDYFLCWMTEAYSITCPIQIQNADGLDYYTNSDIVCEDADGDGLYFWGLGPKPTSCPYWVPDTPDGDDSNIKYGIMDYYGNLDVLPDGVTIKTNICYTADSIITQRIGIVNGGTLTISGTSTLSGNAKIRVCEGGTLIVDGGTLSDADIDLIPTSTLILRNGGTINMASGKTLSAPVGVIVQIDEGEINPYAGT